MRRISIGRATAAFALALIALLVPSTAAFAQAQTTPTNPAVATLTVNKTTTEPCKQIVIQGRDFLPNHEVIITANGVVIGTVMSNASGNFTFPYKVPCSAVAGTIEFKASDGTNVLTVDVEVLSATATQDPTGTLPQTGSNTTETLIRIGVLLIAAGGMVIIATRRRSSRSRV